MLQTTVKADLILIDWYIKLSIGYFIRTCNAIKFAYILNQHDVFNLNMQIIRLNKWESIKKTDINQQSLVYFEQV